MKNKSLILMIVGAIAFPVLVLLPFLIHSTHQFFISASPGIFYNCSADGSVPLAPNQCSTWEEPGQASLIASLGIIGFIIFGILLLSYSKGLSVRAAKKFSFTYLVLSTVIIFSTVLAYALMRPASQNHVISADMVKNISLGYGLTTSSVINLSLIYLAVPLLLTYRVTLSKKYVGALKKKELFQ